MGARNAIMIERILKIQILQKLYALYMRAFGKYRFELDKAVGDCRSLLDVGCGHRSPIRGFSNRLHCVGVDAFLPSIERSRSTRIHNDYKVCDVLDIDKHFGPGSFDCVLSSEVIEHLTPEEGLLLLEKMEKIASEKIIVFTPNGFLPQDGYDGNPGQIHRSGWEVDQMRRLGYEVIGINGLKSFRGYRAKISWWPRWLWRIVSDFSQFHVRNHPEKAFQILCVKTKKKMNHL